MIKSFKKPKKTRLLKAKYKRKIMALKIKYKKLLLNKLWSIIRI